MNGGIRSGSGNLHAIAEVCLCTGNFNRAGIGNSKHCFEVLIEEEPVVVSLTLSAGVCTVLYARERCYNGVGQVVLWFYSWQNYIDIHIIRNCTI